MTAVAGKRVALVLAGGELPLDHLLPALLSATGPVVAADGGLRHAARLGLEPDLLVGDLDSVTADVLAAHPALPVDRRPVEKDELDLELALAAAARLGATSARVIGAFGDRLDQSFAALLIASRRVMAEPAFPVSLHAGRHEGHVASAGRRLRLSAAAGSTVSLLALAGDATVSTEGLRYPLERDPLPFGVGLGVSNELVGSQAVVTCHEGLVAVLLVHRSP